MFLRSLKKTIVFSVVAVMCYGLFVSCENPFASNLGAKVDIEPPTITVLTPVSGDFLQGIVTFSGEATAYRDLRKSNGEYSDTIQVQIYNQADKTRIYLPWTTIGRNKIVPDGSRDKTWTWTYDLDTRDFDDTLFLEMQFRVYDESADVNRKPVETVQLVYIVKNNPSTIKHSMPDQARLDNRTVNEANPVRLITGINEIRGNIIDRRGIKPGYPMIKIWPADLPGGEPSADDTSWGWASLFVIGDDPNEGTGYYADRSNAPVQNISSFVFKLWEFSINRNTRQIIYDRRGGEPTPLPSDQNYRFRIKTSDTYYDIEGMLPRAPVGDEVEKIGYFPAITNLDGDEAAWDRSGPSYVVHLRSSGDPPRVALDNDDIASDALAATPNIYLTPTSMKKIAVGKTGEADFRLQVVASHVSGIERATLEYEHVGTTPVTGFLAWDDVDGGLGYVNDSNKAIEGYRGFLKESGNASRGTRFRFTALGEMKDGLGAPLFKSSDAPYTLIITVYSLGDNEVTTLPLTVYMGREGPTVSIRSLLGATNVPTDPGTTVTLDGAPGGTRISGILINESYTVNENIQVAVDREASQGILSTKWIVEEDKTDYLSATDTMLAKLRTYYATPNSDNYKSAYGDIAEGRMSGRIIPGVTTAPLEIDRIPNLRFNTWKDSGGPNTKNTNLWDTNDLWLYVIAEDGMQNLGFVLQKLTVNDEGDEPNLILEEPQNFFSTTDTGGIASLSDLYYRYGASPSGNTSRKNILDNEGIELYFSDDDGMSMEKGDITITLSELVNGIATITKPLTAAQLNSFLKGSRYLMDNNSKEWKGAMTQKIMAEILYGEGKYTKLPDGYYQLTITSRDNIDAKVKIERTPLLPGDTPAVKNISQTYYFAVQSSAPEITITSPVEGTVLNLTGATNVTISGTVTSGVKIQRLTIGFNPTLTTPPAAVVTLYRTNTYANPITAFGDADRNADGKYVYYWRMQNVDFDKTTPSTNSTSRSFSLLALDALGYENSVGRALEIDTVPPTVSLDFINFNRFPEESTVLNGKVPIEISVYDFGGVKVTPDANYPNDRTKDEVHLRWWILRSTAAVPAWDTPFPTSGSNGTGGKFIASDELGGGRYLAVFDTTNTSLFTTNVSYRLYAMAEDSVGNPSGDNNNSANVLPNRPKLLTPTAFTVNQDEDLPELLEFAPIEGATKSNISDALNITGKVSDDDWFDSDKGNTYVQIRFPRTSGPGPDFLPATWNDADWTYADSEDFDSPAKEMNFIFKTAGHPYFATEGYKYYQIRVTDESEAGARIFQQGSPYGNPPGKNPDGVKTLGSVTSYYPGKTRTSNTAYYSFLLKNTPPQVWFNKHDPNPAHIIYKLDDNNQPVVDPDRGYSASRPAYNNLNALINDLHGLQIQEAVVVTRANFYYQDELEPRGEITNWISATKTPGTDMFPVTLNVATLRDNWLKDIPFTNKSEDEGMYSIAIEAFDQAGGKNRVEWTFYVDNVGPDITFTNVSKDETRIVASRAGRNTYIRGRFSDTYSDVDRNYSYLFDSGTKETVDITANGGSYSGRSANWVILVEDLADGEHELYIEAKDQAGNTSWEIVNFILDSTAPALSNPDDMKVTMKEGAETKLDTKLADYDRVFSAANATSTNTNTIFTLSGVVYDRYLSGLTVVFQESQGAAASATITLPGIYDWIEEGASGTYSAGKYTPPGDSPIITNTTQMSIRKATKDDLGTADNLYLINGLNNYDGNPFDPNNPNHLYVWELVVRGSDLFRVLGTSSVQIPRQITITAQDAGNHNSDMKSWRFFLDKDKPKIGFVNANEKPSLGYSYYDGTALDWIDATLLPARMEVSSNNDFGLEITASDDTNVKEIRYLLSRSDNGTGKPTPVSPWKYYSGSGANSGWNAADPPAEFSAAADWPVLYTGGNPAESLVYKTLNNSELAKVLLNNSAYYPANLVDGLYRLQLRVSDYSKAQTNAGNPVVVDVEFFIDRSEPILTWNTDRTYFRTEDLKFSLTATDTNGIAELVKAELWDYEKTGKLTDVNFNSDLSQLASGNITVSISSMGSNTDGKRYTLVVTVKDKTGREAIIGNTIDFYLDDLAPTIAVTPAGGYEAITGRVMIQNSFTKTDTSRSPVSRVAFKLATFSGSTPSGYGTLPAEITNEWLAANGWFFDHGGTTGVNNPQLKNNTTQQILTQVYPGLSNANVLIPNTRYLMGSVNSGNYLGTKLASNTGYTFGVDAGGNPAPIPSTTEDEIYPMCLYVLVVDEAGNRAVEMVNYAVYPEGDRPKVDSFLNPSALTPEADRLFSGRFRISGTAIDNEYARNVYFRVYKNDETTPTRLSVPNWNISTWAEAPGTQTPEGNGTYPGTADFVDVGGKNHGKGWYMANGGGSLNVSWWAYINAEGELDPPDNAKNKITIQVIAEDTTWDDYANEGNGAWSTSKGLYSKISDIVAYVVSGAPTYSDEIVRRGASQANGTAPPTNTPVFSGWSDYFSLDSEKASPVVWSSALTTNLSRRASYAITVKSLTEIGEIRWTRLDGEVINLLDTKSDYVETTYAQHYANIDGPFVATTNPGIAVRAIPLNTARTEFKVVVDINSYILRSNYSSGTANWEAGATGYYPLNLSATDKSNPVPLTSQTAVRIAIDNAPPQALYTHSSKVAGTSATFGGVAGDKGTVNGLSRVVIWFSRRTTVGTVTAERSVPWAENDSAGNSIAGRTFKGITTPDSTIVGISDLATKFPNVQFPVIPEDGDKDLDYSCVVINQNDTLGNNTHNGHKLGMGWATIGGDLPTSWYAILDSTLMESGAQTVHYVVYDKAGNAAYYNQKIMVMNNVPKILNITLGTNIRADTTLSGMTSSSGTNGITAINNTFGVNTLSNFSKGISERIPITTETAQKYGAVYDQPFNVRNNFLTIQIDASDKVGGLKTRAYRFHYVTGTQLISGTGTNANQIRNATTGVKAGNVYIINDPGRSSTGDQFPWGSLGATAPDDNYIKGLAFLALEDGASLNLSTVANYGTPSVWELRTAEARRLDLTSDASTANFIYAGNAFGTTAGTNIIDSNPDTNTDGRPQGYLSDSVESIDSPTKTPWGAHSLFIIRVFEKTNTTDDELFGDFALLSIRVNNNDATSTFTQLYDLNPKTEEQGQSDALSPGTAMGQNRTRGGLWNDGDAENIAKSGHIEPRKNASTTVLNGTSLTSSEMGGALNSNQASLYKPFADPANYFATDTVSGKVILRGYVEDDQRVGQVDLEFWNQANTTRLQTVTILSRRTPDTAVTGNKNFLTAATGVQHRETIDLDRHRVEWAYTWDTELVPQTAADNTNPMMVGNINVRAVSYNVDRTNAVKTTASPRLTHGNAASTTYDYYNNQNFPRSGTRENTTTVGLGEYRRYNDIRVNIRPYISGILRDQDGLNNRSRQGWYMLRRQETAVIKGFNLAGTGTTTNITLNDTAYNNIAGVPATNNFGITPSAARYRQFTVGTGQLTGHGMVTLTVGTNAAVNTSAERGVTTGTNRRPNAIQPWNTERSSKEGSDLWDDFTSIHIWQSNDSTTNVDNGKFLSTDNWVLLNPAMSVDPVTGVLYASHNEGGMSGSTGDNAANTGFLMESSNKGDGNAAGTNAARRMRFRDPIIQSDIYRTANASWMVTSVIGISSSTGTGDGWWALGGIYIRGPDGGPIDLSSTRNQRFYNKGGDEYVGDSQTPSLTAPPFVDGGPFINEFYLGESTWYNASAASTAVTTPPSTDQFLNPHIIVSTNGGSEHIHVSYYDSKDGSIKYRYNRRGLPGTMKNNDLDITDVTAGNRAAVRTAVANVPKMWANLDGGYDDEDVTQTTYADASIGPGNIGTGARVVNYNSRPLNRINAGEHNAIAVTGSGYPVVAYYDATNQRLKLAISKSTSPILASDWTIQDNIIPTTNLSHSGTGQYVSMAINGSTVHIAALNATSGNLVYVKGTVSTTAFTLSSVQVVDSLGTVGRWCNISLDAQGDPWIAYQEAGYIGSREGGVKLAYLNTARFTKGAAAPYVDQDIDVYGVSVSGWETMHVPTIYSVENPITGTGEHGRIGLENFPTMRATSKKSTVDGGIGGILNFAAVSYLSSDKYRIAYYVK